MAERVYSYDEVHAAMCIWEEIVNPELEGAPQPWTPYRDQWGTAGLRDIIITKLAHECDAAWSRAQERYESDTTDHRVAERETGGLLPELKDPGAFDWEFVPLWIRECVDWSGEHPRIKGSE